MGDSNAARKLISNHKFPSEDGDEYGASRFGGFADYYRRKKVKLQNLDAEIRANARLEGKPQIFSGVIVHVNGYTQPSQNDLHRLVVSHGGAFLQILDSKRLVTHIVATVLTPKKMEEFSKYKVVKPSWITDSIDSGRLLPWHSYRLLHQEGQSMLKLSNTSLSAKAFTFRANYLNNINGKQAAIQSNNVSQGNQLDTPKKVTAEAEGQSTARVAPNLISSPTANDKTRHPSSQFVLSQMKQSIRSISDTARNQQDYLLDDKIVDIPTVPKARSSSIPKQTHTESTAKVRRDERMTAEMYNSALLRDTRIRESTVTNPKFLETYFRESRLHHLSTWKADLKAKLLSRHANSLVPEKSRAGRLPKDVVRLILHADIDCFFAAVSLKKFPEHVGKPAVVAHGHGESSEIASCNYEARKFGIRNGMWIGQAHQLCKDLVIVPYDFVEYEAVSSKFYDAIIATGGIVQSVSVDEALIDISRLCCEEEKRGRIELQVNEAQQREKADEIAQKLRAIVKEETGCDISVGIGSNVLLARIALRKAKPAGQYHIRPGEVQTVLDSLPVDALPGVAKATRTRLLVEANVSSVKELREVGREKLIRMLGNKTGTKLWEYARGIDNTRVGEEQERRSVSVEVNWGVRFENIEQVNEFLGRLCKELEKRLVKEMVKGQLLTCKFMKRAKNSSFNSTKHLGHGECDTVSKSISTGIATNDAPYLTNLSIALLKSLGISAGDLRGIGLQMTKLRSVQMNTQGELVSSQQKLKFEKGPIQVKGDEPRTPIAFKKNERKDGVNDDIVSDGEIMQLCQRKHSIDENDESDIVTPRKACKEDEDIKLANEIQMKNAAEKALNTSGTQFILPSQTDLQVLQELPDSVRRKLRPARPVSPSPCTNHGSRLNLPSDRFDFDIDLPTLSQLDVGGLNALPETLRDKILQAYEQHRDPRARDPMPRREREMAQKTFKRERKKDIQERKRGRTGRKEGDGEGVRTLTQLNYFSNRLTSDYSAVYEGKNCDELDDENLRKLGISPNCYRALPSSLRQEALQDHLRIINGNGDTEEVGGRTEEGGGIKDRVNDSTKATKSAVVRPTFTAKKLSLLEDLRMAMSEWWQRFKQEGPYDEDVRALKEYLRLVVLEEYNMSKACSVVNWLRWIVESRCEDYDNGEKSWMTVIKELETGVSEAIKQRGLGEVVFD